MSGPFIRVDRLEHEVVLLTLSKPHALNAVDAAGPEELRSALHVVTREGSARALVLTGSGRARRLLFTGETISAETAATIGLIDAVLPPSGFMEKVERLAATIARNAPTAVRLTQSLLRRRFADRAPMQETDAAAPAECVMSQDQTEGIAAFLEKRPASYRGW